MKIIAVDVMGAEKGPKPIIKAGLGFIKKNLDYKLILVGDNNEISKIVTEDEKVTIIHTDVSIDPGAKAFDSRNPKSSMAIAIKLVKNKKADAVLSAGSSSAYLTNSVLTLGRIRNVSRPAFLTVLPSVANKPVALLDCGANVNVSGKVIAKWGDMARVFMESAFGMRNPFLGLINVGTEDAKGLPFHAEADTILKMNSKINYVGYIEPNNILKGDVNIILTDGYGGNLILKTMEGVALSMVSVLKQNVTKNIFRKTLALMLKKSLKESFEKFDYRKVGAACIIGVKGLVIKAHGSSDENAFVGAFEQIKKQLDTDFIEQLQREK